jgi:Domain of unknown function DUF29
LEGCVNDLYETDILEWSQTQAELLRRLEAGAWVDNQIDWGNLVREIERAGREQLHSVRSLLTQAMAYRLRILGWPDGRDAAGWYADATRFSIEAADRCTPSMRPRLDLARMYRNAMRILPEPEDGIPPLSLPAESPWSLDELLAAGDGRQVHGSRTDVTTANMEEREDTVLHCRGSCTAAR